MKEGDPELSDTESNDERLVVLRRLVLAYTKGERCEGWRFVPKKIINSGLGTL